MINILSVCDSSAILNTIYIIKIITTTITVIAPILLAVSCMISAVKVMSSNDINITGMLKNWGIKLIAAILIFLIPNFVFMIGNIVTGDNSVKSCYKSASYSRVKQLKKKEEEQSAARILAWQKEQEKKRLEAEAKKQQEQEQKQNGGSSGSKIDLNRYSTGSERNGNSIYTTNLAIITTKNSALGCKVTSAFEGEAELSILRANAKAALELEGILRRVCSFVNSSPYVSTLQTAGAYVGKSGYHGMGLAIDIFNRYRIKGLNEKGRTVTYTPYGKQGISEWYDRYKKFICNVCKGNEKCPQNINYHIYYNYFKPAGWCWGGNWPADIFDPMHFERTNKACSTASATRITAASCGISNTTTTETTTETTKEANTGNNNTKTPVTKPGVDKDKGGVNEYDK